MIGVLAAAERPAECWVKRNNKCAQGTTTGNQVCVGRKGLLVSLLSP